MLYTGVVIDLSSEVWQAGIWT